MMMLILSGRAIEPEIKPEIKPVPDPKFLPKFPLKRSALLTDVIYMD